MGKVLKAATTTGGPTSDAVAEFSFAAQAEAWMSFGLAFTADALTFWTSNQSGGFALFKNGHTTCGPLFSAFLADPGYWVDSWDTSAEGNVPPPTAATWQDCEVHFNGAGPTVEFYVAGTLVYTGIARDATVDEVWAGQAGGFVDPVAIAYIRDFKVGTTRGASDLFADDFSSGDLSAWTSTSGDVSVIDDPFGPIAFVGQRVGIAFDDAPLEPDPTWTWLDSDPSFPAQFVAGYDTHSGRQTLLEQTDTGEATVYINDHELGLFDPRNTDSDYYGKLDGKQIILQLYNPVTDAWESQFRGWIDFASYAIDGSAVDANGDPINASIQLECVDVFDVLGEYGLTPGLDGVVPPAGMEDGVYYAETSGTNDDRIIEILADVGIDSTRYIVASGNTHVMAAKYDPDESALVAIRDACDADLPFIANCYVNRSGQFVFRGRNSRFYPDEVAAEPGSEWDFTRWAVGDGKAIQDDPTRAQMRILTYTRGRQDVINVAISYPQGIAAADMPGQVFADVTSIDKYGKHNAPPMSDLLVAPDQSDTPTPDWDGKTLCAKYAELLVKNKKGAHIDIASLQVKTVHPDDPRATETWDFLTKSDVSHIVNVAVGYPGGTGLTGNSPADDHFIEGRSLTVRPLEPGFDYVELDVETTPVEWSSDFHNVFPDPFS